MIIRYNFFLYKDTLYYSSKNYYIFRIFEFYLLCYLYYREITVDNYHFYVESINRRNLLDMLHASTALKGLVKNITAYIDILRSIIGYIVHQRAGSVKFRLE